MSTRPVIRDRHAAAVRVGDPVRLLAPRPAIDGYISKIKSAGGITKALFVVDPHGFHRRDRWVVGDDIERITDFRAATRDSVWGIGSHELGGHLWSFERADPTKPDDARVTIYHACYIVPRACGHSQVVCQAFDLCPIRAYYESLQLAMQPNLCGHCLDKANGDVQQSHTRNPFDIRNYL